MKSARWHGLELRHLDYAITVKKHQGFVPAAIALKLDQGFLSKQIRRLEARLGFELFDRTIRPLGITAAGQVFLAEAERILSRTDKAIQLAYETQQGHWGRLDVGINTSVANSILPKLLETFLQHYPNVDLMLHELPSYEQIKQLKTRKIDVGLFHKHSLRTPEGLAETFSTLSIFRETLLVVLPEKHRLAKEAKISLAQLDGERFVLPPRTLINGLREQIEQTCAQFNCQPVVVQEAAWITTVLSLVAAKVGVSILPANTKKLRRSGVVYREIEETSPILEILAVKEIDHDSPTVQNFFNLLNQINL
ncbi:LysR family transcriptional regulator [Sphaerothrix gracilis]|uniref:LysR family transcriptional regulator n=1 Tax=Sphaerothrix gracilis TaxID=3151835 RepID=UPI0031FD0D0F